MNRGTSFVFGGGFADGAEPSARSMPTIHSSASPIPRHAWVKKPFVRTRRAGGETVGGFEAFRAAGAGPARASGARRRRRGVTLTLSGRRRGRRRGTVVRMGGDDDVGSTASSRRRWP